MWRFILVYNSCQMGNYYKDVLHFYFINGHRRGPFDILRDFSVTAIGYLKIYYNVTKSIW